MVRQVRAAVRATADKNCGDAKRLVNDLGILILCIVKTQVNAATHKRLPRTIIVASDGHPVAGVLFCVLPG